MNWEIAAQVSGVILVIAGAIGYVITNVVLNPLKDAIRDLGKTVDKFSEQLEKSDERWHNHDIALVRIKDKVDALHRRLDDVEGKPYRRREHNEGLEH
jgi:hypothetical protein